MKVKLDNVDWKILKELQTDARLPLVQLSKKIGLSSPAVAERIRKLEETEVITGYRAIIDPKKVGYGVMAMMRLNPPPKTREKLIEKLKKFAGVIECHRITGEDCYLMKLVLPTIEDLDSVVIELGPLTDMITTIVISTPIHGQAIHPPLKHSKKQRPY